MDVLELTKEFIAVEGHQEHPVFEEDVARKVADTLRAAGIPCEMIEAAPHRHNVKAVLKGSGGGKALVLNTHLDTIPAYNMADAFTPRVVDGRVYGRGACDVRGALACLCLAMISLKREEPLRGDVIFLATCDEESGSLGARAALRGLRADAAVVCEPTGLSVAVAHKGVMWYNADFSGTAAHGGSPDDGHNAVYDAARFVGRLENFDQNILRQRVHPLAGRSTLNVGTIRGGSRHTVVPARCAVEFERRWLPGEKQEDVAAELQGILSEDKRAAAGLRCVLGGEDAPFPSMEIDGGHPVVRAAVSARAQVLGGEAALTGAPFWTEAALFSGLAGIPAAVIGPGHGAQAHSDREYVEIKQLEAAWRIYVRLAVEFCK